MEDAAVARWSDLRNAVENLDLDRARTLIAAGADVRDIEPFGGWTLLHHSIDSEVEAAINTDAPLSVAMTRLLLDAGADPRVPDNRGETALDLAEKRGHTLAVALLIDR
jgi:ankyrin repeat protein